MQGKLSHLKQYERVPDLSFAHVLMRHKTRVFGFTLSSTRHPGHGFLSRKYARHKRQFIPQGAINSSRKVP
jgi:hypothetical protein